MKSTGEVMGIGRTFEIALAKSQKAAGANLELTESLGQCLPCKNGIRCFGQNLVLDRK